MKPDAGAGFRNDASVNRAKTRVAGVPERSSSDVEAPSDLRSAVLSVAGVTARARLGDSADGEKTLTFSRKSDGQVVVASVQALESQGGHVAGVTGNTIAIAHVHGLGLEHNPGPGDHSAVKSASIPSFVIIADTGAVWEVGRQRGVYVQRRLKKSGEAEAWQPFVE